MDDLIIRPAVMEDLAAIREIYNSYVHTSTCTFQTEPDSLEDRTRWFAAHGPMHPVTVAEAGGEVVGWASLSEFHPRCGYRYTVENSVYVRYDRQRQGLGRALLSDLIERARGLEYHAIIAGISADQAASLALHQQFGFTQVGCLREVGYKFGQWLDVVYLQLLL